MTMRRIHLLNNIIDFIQKKFGKREEVNDAPKESKKIDDKPKSIEELLERKKNKQPFYKSVHNSKPWE